MKGVLAVYYREIVNFKNRWLKVWSASIIYPILFLLAFGYGIGREAKVAGVGYVRFLIPGLIAISSMNQAYGVSLEVHISRYYYRLFDEYLIAPIARWEIVVGEMLYGITKGLVPTAVLLGYSLVSKLGYNVTPSFFMFLLLHLCCFSLLGFIVAMVVRSHADQAAFSTFVMTPMLFLSDTFYPIEKMPFFVRPLGYISPLTYSTKLIRASLLGYEVSKAYSVMLVVITLLLFWGALWVARRAEG